MPTPSRSLILAIALVAATQVAPDVARGCARCLSLGAAFHESAVGGDAFDDLLELPSPPPDEEIASAQFTLLGGKQPQPGGLGSPITITYSYNNLLDGGLKDINGVSLPVDLIRDSIEEAFQVWATHAPLHFVEVSDEGGFLDGFSDYPDGQFGKIRLNHLYYNGPDVPGLPPQTKAFAYYPTSGGLNLNSDIFFDDGDPWQEMGALAQPDILGAAIHEIGHTLGLGHSDDPNANMYWIFHRFPGRGTGQLFSDDIAGIHARYGAGVGSVTALVPEPTGWLLATIALFAIMNSSIRKRRA